MIASSPVFGEAVGVPEPLIQIDASRIYDGMTQKASLWNNKVKGNIDYTNFRGFGNSQMVELPQDSIIKSLNVRASTDSIGPWTQPPLKVEATSVLFLNDKVPEKLPDAGFISDERATQLVDIFKRRGCEDVELQNSYGGRDITFKQNGEKVVLSIGYASLEEKIKAWEVYRSGDPPTHNEMLRVDVPMEKSDNPDTGLTVSKDTFQKGCDTLGKATSTVVTSLHELYGAKTPGFTVDLKSPEAQLEADQRKAGFSTSKYSDGEFGFDGKALPSPTFTDEDRLVCDTHQSEWIENRGLGNHQILTMYKDKLVFGRRDKLDTPSHLKADVVIASDVNHNKHYAEEEFGVSRRHFTISADASVTAKFQEISHGKVTDALVIEDLHSVNGTIIFRGNEVSAALFGIIDKIPPKKFGSISIESDYKSVLLPGDMIFVGNAGTDGRKTKPETAKGIGIKYLGNRQFVKVNTEGTGIDPDNAIRKVIGMVAPEALARIEKMETDVEQIKTYRDFLLNMGGDAKALQAAQEMTQLLDQIAQK